MQEIQPEEAEFVDWVREMSGVSDSRARYTIAFLQRVFLIRQSAARVDLTPEAERWLETSDGLFLLALIHSRMQLIGELLSYLEEPRAPEELLAYANQRYGMGWSTRAQVDPRRGLLGGLGAIELTDDGRLILAELGRTARESLVITAPATVEAESEKLAEPDTGPVVDAQAQPSPDLDQLVERLEQTAHDSGDPDAFEKATRDAFAFVGVESEWLEGPARPRSCS